MFMPGTDMAALPPGVLAEVTDGADFGVVTETLPEPTATEAPVPGTEAVTDGSSDGMMGSGGIGSSTPAEGMSPAASSEAEAPAAVARRPAAEAVTVALLGPGFTEALPPTKA
jgi:hypothetical protein